MNISKRFLKHPRTIYAASHLLALYIRLVTLTSRKMWLVDDDAKPYLTGEKNALFSFWHGRMMMLPTVCPPRPMHVLISFHRDGKLISDVISHFGQATIGGSSSNGGSGAVREILKALRRGDNVSITPDGPRGPRQTVCADGVMTIAQLAKLPILPITFSASRRIHLGSWDRFLVALPFSRLCFCYGKPIMVDTSDEDAFRRAVEDAMNALVEKADEAVS